jgi:hypothetical protein
MNKKPLLAVGLLAMTLAALAPTASAADPGPDVDVVLIPGSVSCATVPRTIAVTPELTLKVRGDCGVEAHYHGNIYICQTVPRTINLGNVVVKVTASCGLYVQATV